MRFEHTQVMNFEGALRGMRAPMASWAKSDSTFYVQCEMDEEYYDEVVLDIGRSYCANMENSDQDAYEGAVQEAQDYLFSQRNRYTQWGEHAEVCNVIGPNDMDLCRRLINGGPEHRKFLRQIFVSVDITAPLYWWKEFDTYKVGTTANSTSTMHKLASTPITRECFEMDDFEDIEIEAIYSENDEFIFGYRTDDFMDDIIETLEALRQKYNETKDKRYWKELIRCLPNGWLQTRTVTMNYENLRSIVHQRMGHKLSEWHQFLEWVETLPYAKELIID